VNVPAAENAVNDGLRAIIDRNVTEAHITYGKNMGGTSQIFFPKIGILN
jgi:hypothetical protein